MQCFLYSQPGIMFHVYQKDFVLCLSTCEECGGNQKEVDK